MTRTTKWLCVEKSHSCAVVVFKRLFYLFGTVGVGAAGTGRAVDQAQTHLCSELAVPQWQWRSAMRGQLCIRDFANNQTKESQMNSRLIRKPLALLVAALITTVLTGANAHAAQSSNVVVTNTPLPVSVAETTIVFQGTVIGHVGAPIDVSQCRAIRVVANAGPDGAYYLVLNNADYGGAIPAVMGDAMLLAGEVMGSQVYDLPGRTVMFGIATGQAHVTVLCRPV